MDDRIKLITNRRKSGNYRLVDHGLEMEFLIDFEIAAYENKAARLAITYYDIKFLEYTKFPDELEQIVIETWEKFIFIQGHGLMKIYDGLVQKQLRSLNISKEGDEDTDVKVTTIFYKSRSEATAPAAPVNEE